MARNSPFNVIGSTLRSQSGALAVGEIVFFLPHGESLEKFVTALVHLHVTTITTPDGDDEVDFFLQTAYDAHGAAFVDTALNTLDDPIPGAGAGIIANHEMSLHVGAIGAEPGDILRIGNERMLVMAMDSPAADFVLVRRGYDGDEVAQHALGTDQFLQQVTWEDVANVHFAVADNGNTAEAFIAMGTMATGVAVFAHSDLALADDTNRDLPLGDRLRLVTVLTGATAPTYAYAAYVSLFGDA